MKITRTITLVFAILCALSSVASAGDFSTLNLIGFSKDGRYLAFEEYGMQDGSGFPYSNIYVVDVVKNSFAGNPVRVRIDNETATEKLARSRAKLGSSAAFKRFGIVLGNTGTQVVSRLLTDLSANNVPSKGPNDAQTINFAEIIGSMYQSGDYELKLKSTKTKTKECDAFGDDYDVLMLDVTLYDRENKKTTILQKDSSLPSSRGCPINYVMQHVYLYQGYIAVFINTYHVGFEGPDMRYMVVTGKIK